MKPYTDEQLDNTIGLLLRTGVSVSAAVVLAGGVLYLARHGQTLPDYRSFHGEPSTLRNISGVISGVFSGSARAIIQLGLLLLIATPVARVVLGVTGFLRERDYLYTAITIIVLLLLLFSLFGPQP